MDTGYLERVQDGCRSELNEGVAQALLLEIEDDAGFEDTLVETE